MPYVLFDKIEQMTFEQLQIFIAVAEREHLTQAAAALNLTPSAVSSAIRMLEGRHDIPLFHRVGRGLELTEAGRAAFRVALDAWMDATTALQDTGRAFAAADKRRACKTTC